MVMLSMTLGVQHKPPQFQHFGLFLYLTGMMKVRMTKCHWKGHSIVMSPIFNFYSP